MSKLQGVSVSRTKLTGVVVGGVAVAAACFLAVRYLSHSDERERARSAGAPQLIQAPAFQSAPDPETVRPAEQTEGGRDVLALWRTSILTRNAEGVLACDRLFRDYPVKFTGALQESARTDSEERVRAFSTRMLGKLKDPSLAPFFLERLNDASPYVRENAAWALGELGAVEAADELATLKQKDPVPAVRKAATVALEQRLQRKGR